MEQQKKMSYDWKLFTRDKRDPDILRIGVAGFVRFNKSFIDNFGCTGKKFVKIYFHKEKGHSFIGFNFCEKHVAGETRKVSIRSGHDQGSYISVKHFAKKYKIKLPCLLTNMFLDQKNNENIIGFLLAEPKK